MTVDSQGRSNPLIQMIVKKNCFDELICFKGVEVDNICVSTYWIGRQRKTKNILTRRK